MKRLFVLLVSISLGISLFAVPSIKYQLVVRTTCGDSTFLLSQQPEISFTETSVVIADADSTITISKTEFVQFLFTPSNKCMVTFVDWDGTVLQSSVVNIGDMPEYRGEIPTKESESSRYVFIGWTPELCPVTEDVIYTAQFTEIYEISYYNWDGNLLYSAWYKYGDYPTYTGDKPSRDANAQYTYTFSGWSPEVDVVTGTASYYAQFSETLNQYEVSYYNWDGTLLQSNWYDYGEYPSYTGATPTRESDAQYTYTFTGWSPQLDWVTGTASYYAQYEATLNQYEVTFLNWDGSLLQSSWYYYGEWPSYYGSDPWRDANAQYTYTFTGWSPELDVVTGHASYYAQYETTLNQYEINFYDWDGTLLQSEWVNYGEWPIYYNSDPWREADAQYTYTFIGWSPELSVVTGNQSYTAQYEATLNQYEVTFLNWDGSVLQSTMVNYGEMPIYTNATPTRESDAQYTYTFTGWSPELSVVTGAQSYTAQYDATINQYEVTFLNWDGSVLQSTMVNYGDMPVYTGVTPTRESDAQYTYTFTGWSPGLSMVTGHQSYYAQYEATLNQYEITFYDWDGTLLQSELVNYGEMPSYNGITPTKPEDEQYIYTFLGWDPEITLVIDNAAYTAVYEAIEKVGSSIDDITTGTNKPRKVYIEGKLFIIIGDSVYSGQGHRIK